MVKAMLQLGVVPQDVDLDRLHEDIDRLRKRHLDVPIGETSFPDLVNDLLNTAFRHRIEVPRDFILVGKSLLTLEGIVHELDPTMSLAELAKPFRYQLIKEQLYIFRWVENLRKKIVKENILR